MTDAPRQATCNLVGLLKEQTDFFADSACTRRGGVASFHAIELSPRVRSADSRHAIELSPFSSACFRVLLDCCLTAWHGA